MNKLDEIIAYKRQELALAKRERPVAQLERAVQARPAPRPFQPAISRPDRVNLIAEIKKSSPSAGPIRPDADILEIAGIYERSGAAAISVLTERKFFLGSLEDLTRVREKVSLPVLRKDFLLEEYHLLEAAATGADAVLLIAAVLPQPVLKRLIRFAGDLHLAALVEVHAEPELDAALEAGAEVIGVNNRDLGTLQVDLAVTDRLFPRIPVGKVRVSESGIRSAEEVARVRRAGANAVLIGEELMSAADPGKRIQELMS